MLWESIPILRDHVDARRPMRAEIAGGHHFGGDHCLVYGRALKCGRGESVLPGRGAGETNEAGSSAKRGEKVSRRGDGAVGVGTVAFDSLFQQILLKDNQIIGV